MSFISALAGPVAAGGAALSNALSGLSSNTAAVQADEGTSTSGTNGSSASSSGSTSTSSTTASDPLGSESTFLTLLVSQLQNQDPLSPTDSNQFVSQLTSFSQLEQLINIDQNTTSMASSVSSATSSTGSQPTTGASS